MVCVPCILIPLAVWIYYKFLQPYVVPLIPERWRNWVDSMLYPTGTCPIKAPKQTSTKPSTTRFDSDTVNEFTEKNENSFAAVDDDKSSEEGGTNNENFDDCLCPSADGDGDIKRVPLIVGDKKID